MERKTKAYCQECKQIMEESKHKHFPNELTNVFKAKCVNKNCSEFGKVHVMMEATLTKKVNQENEHRK